MAVVDRRGVTVSATDPAEASDPNPGLAVKAAVKAATTAAITLSGLQTIDGVSLAEGDRVLVKNQADTTLNGIYGASAGNWQRTFDASKNTDFIQGTLVFVNQGQMNAGIVYAVATADDPIVLGTSAITFINQSDVAGAADQATSTTSTAIAPGPKSFATQTGKGFLVNQYALVYSAADASNIMLMKISSYGGGILAGTVVAIGGAGTHADWVIVLNGSPKAAGFSPPVGTGNVTGPGTVATGHLATYADTTGMNLADGGKAGALANLDTLAAAYLAGSALSGGVSMINGTIVESHAGNAATFAIKTLAGADPSASDPVIFVFRDVAAGAGDYVMRLVTAALSITVPAAATLGTANGTPFRIWLAAFDDGGTVRLAVINCLSGTNIFPLGQFPIASSTQTPGNLAQIFYTTGAAVTAKAYAVLGYLSYESGLATAGTWNAAPSWIQLFGPQVPLPGAVVQTQRVTSGAVANGAGTFADADTVPASSGGTQFMSKAITPISAANLLEVESKAFQTADSGSSRLVVMALFQDSQTAALTAIEARPVTSSAPLYGPLSLRWWLLAAAAVATTFKILIGQDVGATTFNGVSSARKLGGAMNSYLEIKEIQT
jgi:uncharacterized cupin superfamily protein